MTSVIIVVKINKHLSFFKRSLLTCR